MRVAVLCVSALVGVMAPRAAVAQSAGVPKVAVVVVGDADAILLEAATDAERALRREPQLLTPADPGLRRALLGAVEERDDSGLERARTLRRRLSGDEQRDIAILVRLGRMAGADAVVAARRQAGGIEAVVLDVARGAFYDGAWDLAATDRSRGLRFVLRRARAALRAAATATVADEESPDSTGAELGLDLSETAPEDEETPFYEQPWAFVAGGALVALVATLLLWPEPAAATDPPVLRFIPGGSR